MYPAAFYIKQQHIFGAAIKIQKEKRLVALFLFFSPFKH
jgi:hypothetical protein